MANWRKNITRKYIRKKQLEANRDTTVHNFKTARSSVILFDALLPDCFPVIKDFLKYLDKQKIQSSVLGYVDEKEVPQEMLFWENIELITRKETNWLYRPKGPVVESFLAKKPDLLFVFGFHLPIPLEYLARLSPAHFKVGCYMEEENDFDLMINTGDGCETAFFVDQVKHYINMLNQ